MRQNNFDNINHVIKTKDFSFSDNTTYALGGKAKIAYFPKTEQEAAEVYDYLIKSNVKFTVLGKGSNVLVSEKGYDGAVICTKLLSDIRLEDNYVYCLSGTTVGKLLQFCVKNGLSGLEYLAGIPASVGGLVLMNGGIPARHIESNVLEVSFYDGKFVDFSQKECQFSNKHSIMSDINGIITSVKLTFTKSTSEEVVKNINYFLKKRGRQPLGKNCGCVFKNPDGMSAGKLIDDAGLKGMSLGGACVSNVHANFILNCGATADEVYSLIKTVKLKVFEKFGVMLEEEVVYIGEFNDFNS